MKRDVIQLATMVATTATLTGVVGCMSVCERSSTPTIVCQPSNQSVAPTQDAVFYVKAKGHNLSYQWFFENGNAPSPVPNGDGPRLIVPASNTNRYGSYWAVITSYGTRGLQQSSTPMFVLSPQLAPLSGSTNLPESEIIYVVSGGPSPGPCCTFCAYGVFNDPNNGGHGYPLGLHQPFKFTIGLSGATLDTSTYCVRYATTNDSGCCSAVSSTETDLVNAPKIGNYVFTLYIKSGCPSANTVYTLTPL